MEFNFKTITKKGGGFSTDLRWSSDVCAVQKKNLVFSRSAVEALDLHVGDKINVMFDLQNNAVKFEKTQATSGWSLSKASKDGRLGTYAGALLKSGSTRGWYSSTPGNPGVYILTERVE